MEIIEKPIFYNYLACSKSQALKYLALRVDITPLMWNAYEPVTSIYEEMVVNRLTPWEYNWELKPFNDEVGIFKEDIVVENFQNGKADIIQLLNEGYTVQLSVLNRFIPHMVQSPQDGNHSLAIISYDKHKDTFKLFDYPYEYEYDAKIIQDGYNHVEDNYYLYYRIQETGRRPTLKHLFQERMLQMSDDFSCYAHLKRQILDRSIATDNLIFFFGVASLSRELTSTFISNNQYSNYLVEISNKIYRQMEVLKQLYLKMYLKTSVSNQELSSIAQKIDTLITLEVEFLNGIKNEILSGNKIDSLIMNPDPPSEVYIKYRTDTSAWLVWSDLEVEKLENMTYEIYINSELIDVCKQNTYIISELLPETNYVVRIKSVNKYGLKSLVDKEVSFRTTAKKTFGNLSYGKPVIASSFEDLDRLHYHIVDEDTSTRWGSLYNDHEWIVIDLGFPKEFNRIRLHWEAAHAIKYRIQISNDFENWIDLHYAETCKGKEEEITKIPNQAQYIRIYCEKRATKFGYSLWEFSVYNDK
ncbi:discoidin domain-containing protein [Paenibacillus agilis]|uniref:F5/8 type C domain-containing protein n=1 Tax=Paenibacillus agilis TaxID=3020863 RepID=A0A559J132_9BACL|nr:discoidin domain-containing protein [Paenibacillus agilis]TVX93551.1 hypothetical protein FPZ44_11100 [Paenibacillus agilis]